LFDVHNDMTSLIIEVYQRSKLESKLEKLNRKAAKLGLAPVVADFQPKIVEREIEGLTREVVVYDVKLTGDAPKLNGWTFVCRVEHTKAGQIVSGPAGSNEDLSPWYECDARECDHCHTNRDRRDTFVLRDAAGQTVRVGRSCLADFVRSEDAYAVAHASLWGDFFPPSEEGGDYSKWVFSVPTLISYAVASIRYDGGYRKEHGTRSSAMFALYPMSSGLDVQGKQEWMDRQPTNEEKAKALEIIEWGKVQGGSDYLHNISVSCNLIIATNYNIGILVSVPAAYNRAVNPPAPKVVQSTLPKVLPEAGRYVVTGVVQSLRVVESTYGIQRKMRIRIETQGGIWDGWSTIPAGMDPKEGEMVSVKATVVPKELGFAILGRPNAVK
jgi:hypothetical protein